MTVTLKLGLLYFSLLYLQHVVGNWRGPVDDCEKCSVDVVDSFNNLKLYPRLASLLNTNYFRFYHINLKRPCPFWPADGACASKSCEVKPCSATDVPGGIKEFPASRTKSTEEKCDIEKTNGEAQDPLGLIDKTLEPKQLEAFRSWRAYDAALYDFCDIDQDTESSAEDEYVDLTLNPERFTGYTGPSTARIWRAIYSENCFKSEKDFFFWTNALSQLCLEERIFYRLISGLHTSITVHLCSKYYNKITETSDAFTHTHSVWGPNFEEFRRRFDNIKTGGQGSSRLRNLYLIYLVELRALAKIAPYLEEEEVFFTGDESQDSEIRDAVKDLLHVVKEFPHHFDEHSVFASLGSQNGQSEDLIRIRLRDEFREKFRNISKIMRCVGCDKCKLWGTLQTHGLGTALKILFWPENQPLPQLRRQEIVALFNAVGRLSTSIRELEVFSHIISAEYNQPESVQNDHASNTVRQDSKNEL